MKKLIAGFMTALMALLPLVSAAELGNYPAFLADEDGTLDALVVIGADAMVSDVVGAINLAVRLAEVGEETVTADCPGAATSVDGVLADKIDLPSSTSGTDLSDPSAFPASGKLKTFHYSTLEDSTFSWKGSAYDFHEEVWIGDATFRHDFSDSKINGTETLLVKSGDIKYRYVFDEDLNLGSATGAGTTSSGEYTYPIKTIELLGTSFQIVGLGTDQVVMLSGSVGTATPTKPVVYEDYSIYSDVGDAGATTPWARVIIKDSADNEVESLYVNKGEDGISSEAGLTIKVTDVRTYADNVVIGTDMVVGATNAVEKTYGASCSITGTAQNDHRFPGTEKWCIQASGFTAANITSGDYIEVVYKPSTKEYLKAGSSVPLPNDYGTLGYEGWNTDKFATLKVEAVAGVVGYDKDDETVSYGNLNGLKLTTDDVTGSIQTPSGNAFSEAYVLFNASQASQDSYPVMIGYKDPNKGVLVDPDAGATDEYAAEVMTLASNETLSYNFTLNYGSVGESTYYVKFTVGNPINNSATVFIGDGFQVGTKIVADYKNSSAWSTSDAPEFRLGAKDSAEDDDVKVTAGGTQVSVGKKTQEVVGDQGLLVEGPETYAGSNQVVVKIPAKDLKIKAYFGEKGEGVSGDAVEYTNYPSIPIKSAIAKLDTEVTAADKDSNLILVGGPCVSGLAQDLVDEGKIDEGYSCAGGTLGSKWVEGKSYIVAVDDAFTTGKTALLVAGTLAQDTQVATSALQLFDTVLDGVTASSVEVSGTIGAPSVTPM